ncbi:MAG: GNAT family N-acetyltransferase [Dehalococcoidia bacterium]|nr:GNAT family N-acetyltransferase [Dehalococcoidia bacterium]
MRAAEAEDLPAIDDLVALVDGDREDLRVDQFVVAEDEAGGILGCARLRPYRGFRELASVAVRDGMRDRGVGREMVTALLSRYRGPLYLVCEDREVGFFAGSAFA